MLLEFNPSLPAPFDSPTMWVKGDVVLTVAFHRLRFLFSRWDDGKRVYDIRVLSNADLSRVRECVRHGIGV
jgi:uncharacterized protein YifN (PemK superfamily)